MRLAAHLIATVADAMTAFAVCWVACLIGGMEWCSTPFLVVWFVVFGLGRFRVCMRLDAERHWWQEEADYWRQRYVAEVLQWELDQEDL